MERKALIDMSDSEVEDYFRDVIQHQGQSVVEAGAELSRRATLKVRDTALQIHEASLEIVRLSKKLEWLTKWLIVLTILLAIVGLPPAIEIAVRYFGQEHSSSVQHGKPRKAIPATVRSSTHISR
jgi:signal transduction histidine kinase